MADYERELQVVVFDNPDSQYRYLERLESRYFEQMMAANLRTFDAAERAYDAVHTALLNFNPATHLERVKNLKMSRD